MLGQRVIFPIDQATQSIILKIDWFLYWFMKANFLVLRMIELACKTFMPIQTLDLRRVDPHCQNQAVKLNHVKASEEGSKPEASCNVIFLMKINYI